MNAYAILDDGSERSILLHLLQGNPEDLPLRTVRQKLKVLHGAAVSFNLSPGCQPNKVYPISGTFTASELGLGVHCHTVKALQKMYRHLKGLPLQDIEAAHPVLLIGSDCPHLIIPVEPVRLGPPGGPS